MQEKIRLIIIIVLVGMLALSAFIGIQTYSAKKAIETERNYLRNENKDLTGKVEEITKERRQLQEKVNALTNNLDKASQEKEDIQKQYESLVKERDEMVEKLNGLEEDTKQLRTDLKNLSQEKKKLSQDLEGNLTSLKNENTQLKEQLDNLNGLKIKLEAELGQLKGDKSDLEQKLNEIDSFLEQSLTGPKYTGLKEELDAIRGGSKIETQAAQPERESVELPAIIVRPQTQAQTETSMPLRKSASFKRTGTVLEVNRENNFVIIDFGQEVGVKLGDTFKVYKQGAPIATIEVIHLRQSISACDIKEEIKAIEAGDMVR